MVKEKLEVVVMNKKLLNKLLKWPKPFIFGKDLIFLLDRSAHSRYSIIKRCIQENYLKRIRRDLFVLTEKCQKELPDSFELAHVIYGPSYISFESALSFHNWIPEAVYTITSATSKRNKNFETFLGMFSYEHVPLPDYHFGVHQYDVDNCVHFIADPWKAIADYIYSRHKTWPSLETLCEDMRIEKESIISSDKGILKQLSLSYHNKRVRDCLNIFLKDIGNEY